MGSTLADYTFILPVVLPKVIHRYTLFIVGQKTMLDLIYSTRGQIPSLGIPMSHTKSSHRAPRSSMSLTRPIKAETRFSQVKLKRIIVSRQNFKGVFMDLLRCTQVRHPPNPSFKKQRKEILTSICVLGHEQAENSRIRGSIVRREPVASIHPLVRTHPV